MDFYSNSTSDSDTQRYADGEEENDADNGTQKTKPLTAEDVAAIVNGALASLRVYVVESDITAAQNSVRAVVEEAAF